MTVILNTVVMVPVPLLETESNCPSRKPTDERPSTIVGVDSDDDNTIVKEQLETAIEEATLLPPAAAGRWVD